MFIFTKWKAKAFSRLQRLSAGLQGKWRGVARFLVPGRDARQADKPGQVQRGSLFRAWSRELGGIFPRGYLPLAGAYILALVLLFAFFIARQGKMPFPGLPGTVKNQVESGLQGEETGQGQSEISGGGLTGSVEKDAGKGATVAGSLEAGAGAGTGVETSDPGIAKKEVLTEKAGTGAGTGDGAGAGTGNGAGAGTGNGAAGSTGGEILPAEELLAGKPVAGNVDMPPPPQAASPLPTWQVCRPYGEHTIEKLPSGGRLHALARGINLTATPGAPVAALWDGQVIKIGGDNSSPYSQFVVLEHSGGYVTFYGNLREVWVEEGGRIYRGEHLGLLPHFPPVEPGATQVVSAAAPAARQEERDDGDGALPLKTIFKGDPAAIETSVWPFEAGNPLLYLEVRQGNTYLDPLSFIAVRN